MLNCFQQKQIPIFSNNVFQLKNSPKLSKRTKELIFVFHYNITQNVVLSVVAAIVVNPLRANELRLSLHVIHNQ